MFTWLKRVLGLEKSARPHPKPEPERPSSPPSTSPSVPETAAPTRPRSGREQALAYQAKVQAKINKLADDFATGTINREQFQKLYAHYQREMQIVDSLLEMDQDAGDWEEAISEGESVLIRQRHVAKAKGYAIYENESGMPLGTLGKFEVDPALFVPMLSSFRSATREIFGAGMQATAIEGGRWLCFVPGKMTTMLTLFSAEPAARQLDFLEQLHRLFEKANRRLLAQPPVDPEALVFPHEQFLGKWRR